MMRRFLLPGGLAAALLAGCTTASGPLWGSGQSGAIRARGAQVGAPAAFWDKEAIFPAARRLIEGARTDIQLDMFYMGGRIGQEIAELLVARKKAGLDVKVLHDPGLGYKEAIKATVRPVMKTLEDGGVETLAFPVRKLRGMAPIKADHNKAFIVDGQVALVGGMNFADVNAPNHDLMVQVGGPSAAYLKAVFKQNWALAAPRDYKGQSDVIGELPALDAPEMTAPVAIDFDEAVPATPPQPPGAPGGTPTQEDAVSVTNSGLYGFPTRPQIATLIDNARQRIWLEMFVLADDDMCARLLRAARRGVEVKVLTDPNKFAFAVNLGGMPNLGAVRKFHGTPVQIQFYDTRDDQQMHVKMCLVDDDKVAAGSTNWTKAGFDTNNETTLLIRSSRFNAELARTFAADWNRSVTANPPSQKSPTFKGSLADWISFLF